MKKQKPKKITFLTVNLTIEQHKAFKAWAKAQSRSCAGALRYIIAQAIGPLFPSN